VAVKLVAAKKIVSAAIYFGRSHPLSWKQNHEGIDIIPESEWVSHFKIQIVKPKSV